MNYMIDLETLSLQPDAAIMQIGLVMFDDEKLIRNHIWIVKPEGRIDGDTVKWWFEQIDNGVRQPLVKPVLLNDALHDMRSRMKELKSVWAYRAHFDIPIIENAFFSHGLVPPWSYKQVIDLATLAKFFPEVKRVKPRAAHWADTDAIAQTKQAIGILERIKELKCAEDI